jgi:hypothetical protein
MELRKFIKTTLREYLNESVLNIPNNIIEYLESKHLFIDKHLKNGTRGSVYLLNNGNCLKISQHNIDIQYNQYVDMRGLQNDYLVNIINVFKTSKYILIEMEKMEPIQFNRYSKFDKINSEEEVVKSEFLSFLNYENNKEDFYDTINDFLNSGDVIDDFKNRLEIDKDDIENILIDLEVMFDGQLELSNKYGFYLKDFHSDNIMESNLTNDYKLIDFL